MSRDARPVSRWLREHERELLRATLLYCRDDVSVAARLLGVERRTLQRKRAKNIPYR